MDSDVEKLRIHTATLGMIHKVLIQRSQICVKKQAGKKKAVQNATRVCGDSV